MKRLFVCSVLIYLLIALMGSVSECSPNDLEFIEVEWNSECSPIDSEFIEVEWSEAGIRHPVLKNVNTPIELCEIYTATLCAHDMVTGSFMSNINYMQSTCESISILEELKMETSQNIYIEIVTSIPISNYTTLSSYHIHATFKFGESCAVEIVSDALPYEKILEAYRETCSYNENNEIESNIISIRDINPNNAFIEWFDELGTEHCYLRIYSIYEPDKYGWEDAVIKVF